MLFAISISPTTSDEPNGSVSHAVARAVKVIRDSGLPHETTSMFTTIEGTWDEVMPVIKSACDAVGEVSPRVQLVMKADLRPGFEGEMTGKLERLERAIDQLPPDEENASR
ncbi:thiamine-binding protein [Actinomyces vulturis]|uniref:thiamine-binding protein n=1 Tax=Actinomyces vulturis TaxID=1857645 RepID=UPI000836DDA4|nr:thiamine-binding protein [Actinomyces vulturis]